VLVDDAAKCLRREEVFLDGEWEKSGSAQFGDLHSLRLHCTSCHGGPHFRQPSTTKHNQIQSLSCHILSQSS